MNELLSKYGAMAIAGLCMVIVLILMAAWLRECNRADSHTDHTGSGIQIIRDTTVRLVPETRIEYRTRPVIRWMPFSHEDSLVLDRARQADAMAFDATIDTVIGKVRVRDTFSYPSMVFRTRVDRTADSFLVIDKTIFLHDTLTRSDTRPWWQDALMVVGAGAIGYTVSTVTK